MANVFRTFRRTRNDETRINGLPSELLALILRHTEPTVLHTLRLSHVCEHWRSVVHADPTLWSHVELSGNAQCAVEVVDALLAHTNHATPLDLTLELEAGHPDLENLGRLVSDHLPHLASLRVTADSTSLRKLQAALVLPAPTLRTLELHDTDERSVALVHPDIFARTVPMLEELVLDNVVPRVWTHFLFAAPSLGELTLAGSMLMPSTFDLAQCIAVAPKLRRLCLDNCTVRPFPAHPEDDGPWQAKELESVTLTGQEESTIRHILDHLDVKALGELEVTPAPLSTLVNVLDSLPTPVIALALEASTGLQTIAVRVVGSVPSSSTTEEPDTEEQEPPIRTGTVPSTSGVPSVLLFHELRNRTASVTHLYISYELWPHLLSLSFPALQVLLLAYTAIPPPAYQLSLFLSAGATQQQQLHAPALQSLILTVPERSAIRVGTLAHLLQNAVKTDKGRLDELVLVNVYAEEESGSSEALVALCEFTSKLLFVPTLPLRLQV